MANVLTPEHLAGVYAKLERASENILTLGVEITAFLKLRPNNGNADNKPNAAQEWATFHAQRVVPPRLGVLTGEIAHHLRSALDHVSWVLSSASFRREHPRWIGFPIFKEPPNQKGDRTVYNRQIGGVTSHAALRLIEELQPYKAARPADQPLAIVQDLDNVDKHQNLVLVAPTFDARVEIPLALFDPIIIGGLEQNEDPLRTKATQKAQIQFSRQVAFAEFGERKNQTVIPSLTELANEIKNIVERFAALNEAD